MAGIAGFIGERISDDGNLLTQMSQAMKYTDDGVVDQWRDKHLAISRVHHGIINPERQPIYNENRSLMIFMDGEVYDYGSYKDFLCSRGHCFKYEQNDAEFCLHLYEELGLDSFEKLNGSFLIAIYDIRTKEFFLINDRFSSYTCFYYVTEKGKLLFSTQLSSLLTSLEVIRKLNIRSIFEFFTFQKVLSTNTFLDDIRAIQPGTILQYHKGKISLKPYWKIQYVETRYPKAYYAEKLAGLLVKSVENKTCGNHRLGILLSGGLDSRTILAASKRKLVAFTMADFENRETRIARRIANAKGCDHIFLKRPKDYYIDILDQAVELGNGMYRFTHAHNLGFLNQIRKQCDILLHGYGIDSLFKKFFYLPEKKLILFGKTITSFTQPLDKLNMPITSIILDWTLYRRKIEGIFAKPYVTQYKKMILESVDAVMSAAESSGAKDPYRKIDYLSSHSAYNVDAYLHLRHNRAYMPERTAVFDNDLFDLHLEIPPRLRLNSDIFKEALKIIDRRLYNIPNANTGASPAVPSSLEWITILGQKFSNNIRGITNRDKTLKESSWPNFNELIRQNGKFKNLIWETITDKDCLPPEIFNIKNIKDLFNSHLERKQNCEDVFLLLLTFGRWLKKYV